MNDFPLAGGYQCDAVRFSLERLGRASVCYCRMCQKATGGPFGALDHADRIHPQMQMAEGSRLAWLDDVAGLPGRPAQEQAEAQAYFVQVRSCQHPDHDTETWPAR